MVRVFKGFRDQRGRALLPFPTACSGPGAEAPGAQGPGARRSLDRLSSGPSLVLRNRHPSPVKGKVSSTAVWFRSPFSAQGL